MTSACVLQIGQQPNPSNWAEAVPLGQGFNVVGFANANGGMLEAFWIDDDVIWHGTQQPSGAWVSSPFFGATGRHLQLNIDLFGHLTFVYVGIDFGIYWVAQSQPGVWADPTTGQVPNGRIGTGQTNLISLATNKNGALEVFYIGLNDSIIYDASQVAGTTEWRNPVTLPSRATATTLLLTSNADGRLECFYTRPSDNLIFHAWQPSPGAGPWVESQLSGGAYSIVAGLQQNGTITIFYKGLDNFLYHNTQNSPGSQSWGGDIRAYTGPSYAADLASGQQPEIVNLGVVQNASQELQVFFGGVNGYCYSTYQSGPNGAYIGGERGYPGSQFFPLLVNGVVNLLYTGESYLLLATVEVNAGPGVSTSGSVSCQGLIGGTQINVVGTVFSDQNGATGVGPFTFTTDSNGSLTNQSFTIEQPGQSGKLSVIVTAGGQIIGPFQAIPYPPS